MRDMNISNITPSGKISLPIEIRRRWGVSRVAILDRGDLAIVRALPNDPVAYFRGRFKNSVGPSTDDLRAEERSAAAAAEIAAG
jgi:bifunctional DNA-binding transcriptional regulator/antitoxin component of YhaV-PrlF toxin-antitoxin module